MSNITEAGVVTIGTLRSQWALTDDQINSAAYAADDDDTESQLQVAGVSIPTVWVVMLVILFSACIGITLFFCSYYHERLTRCGREDDVIAGEADESVWMQRTQDIERRLKLKQWEDDGEPFNDEHTRHSSSSESDEDDLVSLGSESEASCVSCASILMQDPAFVRLSQRPRCILCSKFFKETDTVSESWEPTCKHSFHKTCIVSWLQKNDGCPVCKRAYVVGIAVAEEP